MPAREFAILALVLLVALAPIADAHQPEPKWKFDGFTANQSAGEMPHHPVIPLPKSTLNFWIIDLNLPEEDATQLRQIHDAMVRSIEVAWLTTNEQISDIKHLNEHKDDKKADAAQAIHKITTEYHDFVNTQSGEFFADIPLLLSQESAVKWEANERVRWRRMMLECASLDHAAVNLQEMFGPAILSLESPAREQAGDILARHITRIDPILEAAETAATPLTRLAQDYVTAELQRDLSEDSEFKANIKEKRRELSEQISDAVLTLIRHCEDVREIVLEDADRLRPLLPPHEAEILDATLRTPSQREFAAASLGSPRYAFMLNALGEDLTGTHLYLGSAWHDFFNSSRTTRPKNPLSERQRRDIAEITEWHRDQQQHFVDEIQRLLPGVDYLSGGLGRRFSRNVRIPTGTLHFDRYDFGDIDDPTIRQEVIRLLHEQAIYEAEAVQRLRQQLTFEQRMLIARR